MEDEMPEKHEWPPKPITGIPRRDDLAAKRMESVQALTQEEMHNLLEDLNNRAPETIKNMVFPATPRGELLRLHYELSEEARQLMEKKNSDYATDQDPYRNFRSFGTYGILVRMSDKFSRLVSFIESGKLNVEDESVRDTVLDLMNYCVLFLGMVYERPKG